MGRNKTPRQLPEALIAMNRRYFISFAVLISLSATTSFAEDKPPTAKEIKALIQQLVSPNRIPDIPYGSADYPAGYDRDAQKHVRDAWSELHHIGLRGFPYLFDGFDDKRYCFTDDAGSADANWTVGRACSDMVICQLQPYANHGDFAFFESDGVRHKRPSYSMHYKLRTSAGARLWWETRKDKSLRELQIEALEWIVTEEARTPSAYSHEERGHLNDALRKLRAGTTPLPPSVPWAR